MYTITESVILGSTNTKESIKIILGEIVSSGISQEGLRFKIILSEGDIGFIISYLLQYYRDNCAPVSRVEIELAYYNGKFGKDVSLVIKTFEVKGN